MLALASSLDRSALARPISPECEVDACLPRVTVVGSAVGYLDVTYAIDPNTVFGLPATIYYAEAPA